MHKYMWVRQDNHKAKDQVTAARMRHGVTEIGNEHRQFQQANERMFTNPFRDIDCKHKSTNHENQPKGTKAG
jgi:hypothetical protein